MRRLVAHWTRLTLRDAPCARSSHRLSAVNGDAYLFGGEATARHAIDATLHRLDAAAGTWHSIKPAHAPPPRVGHAQAAVGGRLYVFGGRAGVEMGEAEMGDLWEYDAAAEAWQNVDVPSAPSARSFHASTAANGTFFVFGGCGADGRMSDLHRFCTTSRRWEELPPPPGVAGRGGAALEASADGKELWLAGGFCGHETNDLLRFCLQRGTWERLPSDWLRPRSVCASLALRHGLLLFGGEVSPSDRGHEGAGGFASDLVAIDSRDGAPLDVRVAPGDTPAARGWGSATSLSDSSGLLFGGLAGSDAAPERLDDAWLLRLEED